MVFSLVHGRLYGAGIPISSSLYPFSFAAYGSVSAHSLVDGVGLAGFL